MRFAIAPLNPKSISILFPSIVWKYTIIMDNQNHSISNEGSYNFHSMAFYGFSKFVPVLSQYLDLQRLNSLKS
jgi:hypothetical protein